MNFTKLNSSAYQDEFHLEKEAVATGFVDMTLIVNEKFLLQRYPDIEDNIVCYFEEQTNELASLPDQYKHYDKLELPAAPKALFALLAETNKINHGFDTPRDSNLTKDEEKFVELMEDFYNELATHAVLMSPDMPESLPESKEVFTHVISMFTWGDKYFGRQNACKSAIECLESFNYYPSEIFTDLLSQYLDGDKKSVKTVSFSTDAHMVNLPPMSSKTGLTIRLQKDIPQPTAQSALVMLKAINEMANCFSSLPDSAISNYDPNVDVGSFRDGFVGSLNRISSVLNMAYAEEQPIFKKAISGKTMSHEMSM